MLRGDNKSFSCPYSKRAQRKERKGKKNPDGRCCFSFILGWKGRRFIFLSGVGMMDNTSGNRVVWRSVCQMTNRVLYKKDSF